MSNNTDILKTNKQLFERVVAILEEARANVVRSVNSNMVISYWLIGREIVEEIQKGESRAEYGKQAIANLSKKLQNRYCKGFSVANLKRFRQFYQVFQDRLICSPAGSLSEAELAPRQGANSLAPAIPVKSAILHPEGSGFRKGFNPQLSWSHYRAIMRVKDAATREFYEKERKLIESDLLNNDNEMSKG